MLFLMSDVTWISDRTWIDNTLRAMEDLDVSIKTSIAGLVEWTNHDIFLMDMAMRQLKGKDLAIFNKVRLFLKVVTTLSDIMTADSKYADEGKLTCQETSTSPTPSTSAYIWPTVTEPTRSKKKIWTEAIF